MPLVLESMEKKFHSTACNISVPTDFDTNRKSPLRRRWAEKGLIEAFLDELKRLDGIWEFQPALWYGLADYMTVYSKDDVRVIFKDGTEIQS